LGSYSLEQGKLLVNFPNVLYAGTYKAAAHIDMTSGTVTELTNVSFSLDTMNSNNIGTTYLLEGDSSKKIEYRGPFLYSDGVRRYGFDGHDTDVDGTRLFLGRSFHIGTDANNVYGTAAVHNNVPQVVYFYRDTSGTSGNALTYRWLFSLTLGARFTNASEFRFRFRGGVTPWIAWDADLDAIKTAILTVYPENTGGVVSNVRLNPFRVDPYVDNTYFNHVEVNLEAWFAGFNNPTGRLQGYITPSHLTGGRITIETRNAVPFNPAGIVAWTRSGGDIAWSRTWGSPVSGGPDLQYPKYAWTRGDYLYAYGDLVENDL